MPTLTKPLAFLKGLAATGLLATGCAHLAHEAEGDPLVAYRATELRPAASQEELEAMLSANWRLGRDRTPSLGGLPGPIPEAPGPDQAQDLDYVQVTGSKILPEDLITNVQTPGIDEGGILKRAGAHLLVLRGSRVHSIRIDGERGPDLRIEESVELRAPAEAQKIWFDELIALPGGALVLAFDNENDFSAIHILRRDAGGGLASGGRIEIRSDDYYSGSNYGFRLVGDQLLFQVRVALDHQDRLDWPMWRSVEDQRPGAWHSLIEPGDIWLPVAPVTYPVVHAFVMCDVSGLMERGLDCRVRGLVSDNDSQLYVSSNAAYLAIAGWSEAAFGLEDFQLRHWQSRHDPRRAELVRTLIYRLPLDAGEAPGVVVLRGEAGTQFSFREIGDRLVAVTETAFPPGSDATGRILEVHQIPIEAFGLSPTDDDSGRFLLAELAASHAHRTIRIDADAVLVGAHSRMWAGAESSPGHTDLIVQPLSGAPAASIRLIQSVDRIELLDGRVFVSGRSTDGAWVLGLVDPESLRVGAELFIHGHTNAEDRSHAFNWQILAGGGLLLGLPGIPAGGEVADPGHSMWRHTTPDLMFATARGLDLLPAGFLDMQSPDGPGEDCFEAGTCWDWYGNARVAFIGGRVFALSGNRLVEARLDDHAIVLTRAVVLDD